MRGLTAGRPATGSAARDGSERPSSNAKHLDGSLGARYGPVSRIALLRGSPPIGRELVSGTGNGGALAAGQPAWQV